MREASSPALGLGAIVGPLALRAAEAYLAIAVMAYIEAYAVGLSWFDHFVGAFELGQATQMLWPVAYLAAAPAAVLAAVIVELLRASDGRRTSLARLTTTAIAALAGSALGFGVAAGRHFEGGLRIPFALFFGACSAVCAYGFAPALAPWLTPSRRLPRAALVAATAASAIVVVDLLNLHVLPRLYPPFHAALSACAVLLAAAGSVSFAALDPDPQEAKSRLGRVAGPAIRATVAAIAFALGAAKAGAAAKRLAVLDNVRIIYLEHAPVLSYVIEIAAALAPPRPMDEPAELPSIEASRHALDLAGRDILLITIDALRADHVGAYGYPRPTTPNADRLAASGVLFDAAYSPTPHTSYAVTSLMTGKYVRPLVLQGLGEDSDTWALFLQKYGYRTAAFYPPAVFFIDAERFTGFRDRGLDFEYRRVEFTPAGKRVDAVRAYLEKQAREQRLFLWVHLFEPHEPYEAHAEFPFGDRDVDRYDSEIAAADAGAGAIIDAVRAARPNTLVILTADHGEEFGEHGGRYHGTTVYEEQVRVPLIVSAPGLVPAGRRVAAPVQLIDLLPTVLEGLSIPRPARVRGTDLGSYLASSSPAAAPKPGPAIALPGFAFSETDTQTMLARGPLRLVCARRISACAIYDVERDPAETTDLSSQKPTELSALRAELRAVEASHGRYERLGLRKEGKGWPEALRRGIAGDGDAAADVAALLDDADVTIRRKAAEVLFELARGDAAAPLRLALTRDEDEEVRRYAALALTRLGEGAPKVRDLAQDHDVRWRRLAALALAESGDDRGVDVLLAWWREAYPIPPEPTLANPYPKKPVPVPIPFERARQIVAAFGRVRSKAAVGPLLGALDDVRLRPHIAKALAAIGDEIARPALADQLRRERYQLARVAIVEALVKLGAGPELRAPLVRLLGTPDPLPDGVRFAERGRVIELVGGPRERDLDRLRRFATSGVAVGIIVPRLSRKEREGIPDDDGPRDGLVPLRVLCRARSTDRRAGEIRFGPRAGPAPSKRDHDSFVPGKAPDVDPARMTVLSVPAVDTATEVFASLPRTVNVKAGDYADFVVYATQNVEVEACVVVPLEKELPPPPPEPWTPSEPPP